MSSVIWPDSPLTAQEAQVFAELSDRLDELDESEQQEWHRLNDAINLAILKGRQADPWLVVIKRSTDPCVHRSADGEPRTILPIYRPADGAPRTDPGVHRSADGEPPSTQTLVYRPADGEPRTDPGIVLIEETEKNNGV